MANLKTNAETSRRGGAETSRDAMTFNDFESLYSSKNTYAQIEQFKILRVQKKKPKNKKLVINIGKPKNRKFSPKITVNKEEPLTVSVIEAAHA